MNFKLLISAIVSIIILAGCPGNAIVESEIDVKGDLFTLGSRLDTLDRNVHSALKFKSIDRGFVIAKDQKPCLISDLVLNSNLSMERDTYKLTIVTSKKIFDSGANMNLDWTNSLLRSMNAGFVIDDTDIDLVELDNIDSLNTNGRVNTDNIIAELDSFLIMAKKGRKVDNLNDIVVLLFNDSEFFNTANAIAINHGEKQKQKHYIFGDADLLVTPMIFLHELGHAFNLTHSNDTIQTCGTMYNIMHESNIGCTAGFTARQVALMSIDKYIGTTEEVYYPDVNPCHCSNVNDIFSNDIEKYLNSIDRNIDDTPLVGMHEILEYVSDSFIQDSIIYESIFRTNYEDEFKRFINPVLDPAYVNQRVNSHFKLRRNNLMRWFNHNRESIGLPMVSMANLRNKDSLNVAVSEYNIRIDKVINFDCSENEGNCESLLICLENRIRNLENRENGRSQIGNSVIRSDKVNAIIIDSLNTQIRRLHFLLEQIEEEPTKEDIVEVKELVKSLIYKEAKVIKSRKIDKK